MSQIKIIVGSVEIQCDATLAAAAGWDCSYSDGIARDKTLCGMALRSMAEALSEGFDGEMAVMRAIGLRNQREENRSLESLRVKAAETEARAAGLGVAAANRNLWASRNEAQTAEVFRKS